MTHQTTKETLRENRLAISLAIALILIIGVFVYAFLKISSLNEKISSLSSDLASTTLALYGTTGSLSQNLSDLRSQTVGLSQTLTNTNDNLSAIRNQVGGVEGTVSTLQKLVATDPEFLKKYSKVFFLNENYKPAHLSVIPQDYVYSNTKQEQFLTEAWPFLQSLLTSAKNEGVTILIKSAYRSFAEQQALKSDFRVVYGAGTANSFSADQGYSEHQLGTAIDFITSGLNGELSVAFEKTPAFQWLIGNAHKYGFELSYPKGNAYYIYEPWHWRFVGVKLATYLHDNNKNFYDMDQRDIDAYLVNFFD